MIASRMGIYTQVWRNIIHTRHRVWTGCERNFTITTEFCIMGSEKFWEMRFDWHSCLVWMGMILQHKSLRFFSIRCCSQYERGISPTHSHLAARVIAVGWSARCMSWSSSSGAVNIMLNDQPRWLGKGFNLATPDHWQRRGYWCIKVDFWHQSKDEPLSTSIIDWTMCLSPAWWRAGGQWRWSHRRGEAGFHDASIRFVYWVETEFLLYYAHSGHWDEHFAHIPCHKSSPWGIPWGILSNVCIWVQF